MSGTRPEDAGHYARKQLLSPSRLIAWSHRRRFDTGLTLVRALAARRVLDYGCGDGTFLALLMKEPRAPERAVGAEIAPDLVEDCRRRLGAVPGLDFVLVSELDRPAHAGAYDAVVCMEVLEHVVDREAVLDRLVALLAPGGALVISVPVETGPVLPLKQLGRRVAGWRGIGDYPGTSPYTLRELARSLAPGARQHVERPVHRAPDGTPFHDHKGFNWKLLREELRARVDVKRVVSSPLAWLPPPLGAQVWFVGRRRP